MTALPERIPIDETHKGFLIARHKFYEISIFVEYHWDHTSFPTAQPLFAIEPAPFADLDLSDNHEIIDYLDNHPIKPFAEAFIRSLWEKSFNERRAQMHGKVTL